MLGPASDCATGSTEWALRLANELNYTVRNAAEFGVEPIIPLVTQAIDHSPWKVWPEGKPAGSIDGFFLYATGRTYRQIHTLISEYIRDDALARRLAGAKGKDDGTVSQGTRTDLELVRGSHKLKKGNTDEHLLRRLGRKYQDHLAAYERGEYKIVRDAARAAGIKVDPTPLQILRRAWKRASSDERAIFAAEIMQK
jgi:hypothetical protein